jgi:predicted MFS family arabinose efflux permease
MTERLRPPSLLRDTQFRRLLCAVELSFLGLFIQSAAGGWIMTGLTDSTTMVALIQTAYALPTVLLSVLAGALADTLDRRRMMIWSMLASLLASVLMATLSWYGGLGPWMILGLIFMGGTGLAVFTPSWQASLGDIAPRDRLPEAVSLHNMGANVMRTIGPSAGGTLVSAVGATLTLAAGAATFVPALVALWLWRRPATPAEPSESVGGALAAGIRFIAVSPQLAAVLLRVFGFTLAAISVMALLPLTARDQLGLGASGFGLLFGVFGLGAILGGLCLPLLRRHWSTETILRGMILANATAVALLALAWDLALAGTANLLAGACWLIMLSLLNSTLQLATPRWIVGRMLSMFLAAAYLGMAMGSWLWGMVAEGLTTRGALAAAALAMLATLALARLCPLPATDGISLEPAEQKGVGEPAGIDQGSDTGLRLHVAIRHRVAPAQHDAFLHLMGRRRRHLTRLGARGWNLLRDIRDPTCFSEHFCIRDQNDYRRLLSRRTEETRILRQEIRAVQQDGTEPQVELLEEAPYPRG